jgi:hypothetical protein
MTRLIHLKRVLGDPVNPCDRDFGLRESISKAHFQEKSQWSPCIKFMLLDSAPQQRVATKRFVLDIK